MSQDCLPATTEFEMRQLRAELAEAKARIAELEKRQALSAAESDTYTPDLSTEEQLIWILGDMMNGVENFFGAPNLKRLGHIYCCADRILREVIDLRAERMPIWDRARAALAP